MGNIRMVFLCVMISHMLEIQLNDYEMPTSARLVFMVLKRLRIADFRTIEMESGLSKRSVLYAVKRLREMGLIDIQVCLNDTRKKFYCIRIKERNPLETA